MDGMLRTSRSSSERGVGDAEDVVIGTQDDCFGADGLDQLADLGRIEQRHRVAVLVERGFGRGGEVLIEGTIGGDEEVWSDHVVQAGSVGEDRLRSQVAGARAVGPFVQAWPE